MAVFKCKMCGGSLEIAENKTVCECEYCGTTQTIPSLDNEKKMNLFNRANRLRFKNEFDSAKAIFENIVAEFPEEAEAYWGLCLCKYGIEYVDDAATAKKIPTCHRTSFDSILNDDNFALAVEHADSIAKSLYKNEAKEIDRLQQAILSIAKNEKPYDIFICYKEKAENGERTKDSVLAQDMYETLTEKGYKVFFARISLEDKLGQEYEPYIFSALNSAKIMLSVGTSSEYFNAVWVRNEWSRFLELIRKDKSKHLIPCYADIDAYDIPEQFNNLQAQDMNKIGFMQDLVRGINKLISPQKASGTDGGVVIATPKVENILKRVTIALESGEFNEAGRLLDNALNFDTENGKAYYYQLMVQCHAKDDEALMASNEPIESKPAYSRAMKYGDQAQKEKLKVINQKNKVHICYIWALNDFANGRILEAQKAFESLGDYADSKAYLSKCHDVIALTNTIQDYRREVGDGQDYITVRMQKENPDKYSTFINMQNGVIKQRQGRNKYGESGIDFGIAGIAVLLGTMLTIIPTQITENWGSFICSLAVAIFIPIKYINGILKKIGIGLVIFFVAGGLLSVAPYIFVWLFLIAGIVSSGMSIYYYRNGGSYELAVNEAKDYYNEVILPLEDSIRKDVQKRYPVGKDFEIGLQGIARIDEI